MPALANQPVNPNFLAKTNLRFLLKRSPNIVFFGYAARLPSISLDIATQKTPFLNIPRPGTKLHYDDFQYTFHVDEDFLNYMEMYNWMNNIGFPDDFSLYPQGRTESATGDNIFSDATLSILDAAKNPNVEFKFINMFPFELGGLSFNVGDETYPYIDCTVTFKYQRFYFNKLGFNS